MSRYAYMHEECGKPAFYMGHKPEPFDRLRARDVVMPDGSTPSPCDPVFCGSCGARIETIHSKFVEEAA